ncbi:MAG: hypothetical protein NNA23_05255 [Nitrospira sp.]|nr:hypothetical protein [Nitrospira sp.]
MRQATVTTCAMTFPEDLEAHAKILSESYDVPLDAMTTLLRGGLWVSAGGRIVDARSVCLCHRSERRKPQTDLRLGSGPVCRGGATVTGAGG